MKRRQSEFFIITPSMYFIGALMLMVLPLGWVFSFLIAVAVHEGFHYFAIWLCGGEVTCLTVDAGGMIMEVVPLSAGKELICTLAGPMGSFLLSLCIHRLPMVGLCAAVQLLYNLIPVYPLDGGRAIFCIMKMLLSPPAAQTIVLWISRIFVVCLLGTTLWVSYSLSLGIIPVLIPFFLWVKIRKFRKPFCSAQSGS